MFGIGAKDMSSKNEEVEAIEEVIASDTTPSGATPSDDEQIVEVRREPKEGRACGEKSH